MAKQKNRKKRAEKVEKSKKDQKEQNEKKKEKEVVLPLFLFPFCTRSSSAIGSSPRMSLACHLRVTRVSLECHLHITCVLLACHSSPFFTRLWKCQNWKKKYWYEIRASFSLYFWHFVSANTPSSASLQRGLVRSSLNNCGLRAISDLLFPVDDLRGPTGDD